MDPRKVRKIWQLIYDAFGFDIPVEAIKSKIYSRRSNQINQSRLWQITFWWSPCSLATLSCIWPPRDSQPEFKLALFGVTTLPATEKTRSNLDEVAGTGKTLLTSLARRGTESRDASPITAGPLWTAHQATVGKTSFFTPWGTLNFFSSSYSSSFTISLLFCACRWFLKALVEPWQTLMTKAEPAMMNIY